MKIPAIFCWSGGKDSAYTLYRVLQSEQYEIQYLVTTLSQEHKRISMHGVKEEMLDRQAEALGLPLRKVFVSAATNEEYEQKMTEAFVEAREKGIQHIVFGDIFLEDLRTYREKILDKISMHGLFPIWKQNTHKLIQDFLQLGFQSVICCVNDRYFGEEDVGQLINSAFINQLAVEVDPCGENGEFHSYCFDGPIFKKAIPIKVGEKVYKPLPIHLIDENEKGVKRTLGFWYCEIMLNNGNHFA